MNLLRKKILYGLGGVFCVALLLLVPSTSAQERSITMLDHMTYEEALQVYEDCGLRKRDVNAFKSRRPDSAAFQKDKSATIQVNYGSNFPTEAREAFERAVGVWERHISSPISIVIDASYEDLGTNTLGSAGPLLALVDTNGDGTSDTILGLPLLDALTGENQFEQQTDIDIVARFNSSRDDWHFGDDPAPAGTIDFTSVVLHEIGHGLNYVDVSNYDASSGSGGYGFDFDDSGQIDEDERVPGPYLEGLVERQSDGSLLSLIDETEFPNPSLELGNALTSDQLFFTGERSEEAAMQGSGPAQPKVYAPTDFRSGSSISHLDEDTYPFESTNALMTPFLDQAETNRLPGPIVCGQLLDMGWTAGAGCAFEEVTIESVTANEETSQSNQGSVTVNWSLSSGASVVDRFVIEQIYFDKKKIEKSVAAQGAGKYSATFSELEVGEHTFRVNYVTPGGDRVQSGNIPSITIAAQTPEVSVYPNPFDEWVNVSFTLPDKQDLTVEVFDALGRRVASLRRDDVRADDPRPIRVTASDLGSRSSGVYLVRVEGEQFEQTVQAVRVR